MKMSRIDRNIETQFPSMAKSNKDHIAAAAFDTTVTTVML